MITNLIQAIKTYKGYLMTNLTIKDLISILTFFSGIAIAIYGYGVKNANKANNTADLVEKVILLERTVNNLSAYQQDLIVKVSGIENKFDNYVMKQDKLTVNFSKLAMKISESNEELMTYMNGLTFEVVQDEPMKSVFPNPKIRIQQVPRDSVK